MFQAALSMCGTSAAKNASISNKEQQRGMLGVSIDDEGMVRMEHQFTDKTFEFVRSDLDEVIDVLSEFRAALEKGEVH